MFLVSYENYKGGVNNLCVAEWTKDYYCVEVATSTKGREAAVKNLRRKLRKNGLIKEANECY